MSGDTTRDDDQQEKNFSEIIPIKELNKENSFRDIKHLTEEHIQPFLGIERRRAITLWDKWSQTQDPWFSTRLEGQSSFLVLGVEEDVRVTWETFQQKHAEEIIAQLESDDEGEIAKALHHLSQHRSCMLNCPPRIGKAYRQLSRQTQGKDSPNEESPQAGSS